MIGALSDTAKCLTRQMHGFHVQAPRLPPAGKRMILTMGFHARAHTACILHSYRCHNSRRSSQAACGATSVRSSCKLCVVRQRRTAAHFFPPDDDAWMDIHEHVCTRSRPARPSHRRFSRRLTSLVPRLMRIGTTKMRSIRCFFCFSSPQASYLEGMYMDNIPYHKDFTRSKPGDCSAFLCHFLGPRGKRSTCAV